MKKMLDSNCERLAILSENTLVYKYLYWLDKFLCKEKNGDETYSVYREAVKKSEEVRQAGSHPFLSVIMRTQGKRLQELQEVLLCLGAQTDMDFEVLLIGHRLLEEQKGQVLAIVSKQPEELKDSIRFFSLDYGTRATPLNFGFAHSYGDYAVVLDDDDLVFDNWVEAFHKTARMKNGTVLHSYCFEQDWSRLKGEKMADSLRAVGRPKAEYCKDFFVVRELYMNECPLMTMAFPLSLFRDFGVYFDETLNTTEDWDYIMRNAFICGVSDTKEATCIYRQWINAENSHTIHNEEEWKRNYDIIQKKFEGFPILLGKGDIPKVSHIMKELDDFEWIKKNARREKKLLEEDYRKKRDDQCKRWESTLYLNYGEGYQETEKEIIDGAKNKVNDRYRFYWGPSNNKKRLCEIRWDPTELAGLIIEKCEIKVLYDDKTERLFQGKKLIHNGYMYNGKIFFPLNDPWIMIPIVSNKVLCKLVIEAKMERGNSSDMIRLLLPKQKIKRIIRNFYN